MSRRFCNGGESEGRDVSSVGGRNNQVQRVLQLSCKLV